MKKENFYWPKKFCFNPDSSLLLFHQLHMHEFEEFKDKVLALIATKLKETGGRVIRYGGDEFIVIFDYSLSYQHVQDKIESLLRYFHKVHFKVMDQSFKIDFAFGIAPFTKNTDVSLVIEIADKAMYHRKREGTKDE